jgi:Mor family transcriptional regulator
LSHVFSLPQCGQVRPNCTVGYCWPQLALAQLQHLMAMIGGSSFYIAKGVAVHLSARDRQMCAKFRGNNYFALAREYGLTEMRVRQIVGAWQQEQFLRRQGQLPGLD